MFSFIGARFDEATLVKSTASHLHTTQLRTFADLACWTFVPYVRSDLLEPNQPVANYLSPWAMDGL